MKISLLVLLCVLWGNLHELRPNPNQSIATETPNQSTTHKVSITFIGTVKSIEMLGDRELKVIPVDFDSRYAITVHIQEVTPEEDPLKAGADQIFAIHSPARVFSAGHEQIIGKKYRFKVALKSTGSSSRFSELTAVPIVDEAM